MCDVAPACNEPNVYAGCTRAAPWRAHPTINHQIVNLKRLIVIRTRSTSASERSVTTSAMGMRPESYYPKIARNREEYQGLSPIPEPRRLITQRVFAVPAADDGGGTGSRGAVARAAPAGALAAARAAQPRLRRSAESAPPHATRSRP